MQLTHNAIIGKAGLALASLTLLGLAAVQPAQAQFAWTQWTAATSGDTTGTATGTLNVSGFSPITVSYSGDVLFANVNGAGTNYWLPSSPYISTEVPNAPPDSDIVTLTGGANTSVNTVTFSSPILNPVFAINSLGSPSDIVDYTYSAPFDLLSQGTGYWGAGTLTQLPGNVLEGADGDGPLRFKGTFSSISWTVPQYENWHGFTVGVEGVGSPVPEASTLVSTGLLLCLGLGGLVWSARRKKGQAAE